MKSHSSMTWCACVLAGLAVLVAGPAARAAGDDAERRDAAFRSFDEWLETAAAGAAVETMDTEEGVALARERRRALLELARTDPREALARALPFSTIKRLP